MRLAAGSFGAGLVAGVALCVAPAAVVMSALSPSSGVIPWLYFAWLSFAYPWRLLASF